MKRVISIFSALVVLCTILLIPVSATEVDSNASAFQPTFDNLLDIATEYEMQAYKNGSLSVTQYMKDPIVQINSGGYDIHFIWGDVYSRSYYDYILIGLQIPNRPVSVTFNDLTGTFLSQSNGICYYKVNFSKTSNAKYDLFVDLGTNTGELKIVSCFGVIDSNVPITSGLFRLRSIDPTDESWGYPINEYVSIPSYPRVLMVYDGKWSFDLAVNIPDPYAESISFTFLSQNLSPNFMGGPILGDAGGIYLYTGEETQETLPYTASYAASSEPVGAYYNYLVTVTVNLEGILLTDYTIRLRCSLYPTGDHPIMGVNLLGVSYRQSLDSKPWYMRLFYWFQGEFMSLRNHLVALFNNIDSTLKEGFGAGEDSSLTPDQEQSQDKIDQDKEDVDDQLQDIIDGLDQAPTVPDYDDTGLDEFKDQVDGNLSPVQPVFVVIFENPLVLQYVIYVFMFALGGFLLFGER